MREHFQKQILNSIIDLALVIASDKIDYVNTQTVQLPYS